MKCLSNFFDTVKKEFQITDIKGIIHIGAHKGEEIEEYIKNGITNIIFIEPIPYIYNELLKNVEKYNCNIKCYCLAISDKNSIENFYVTNHTMSSSLLKLKDHKIIEPNVKEIDTIKVNTFTFKSFVENNSININDYNFLIMDTQGSEFNILQGMGSYLNNIQYIITEVSKIELYETCELYENLDNLLNLNKFTMKKECFEAETWGDVFYIRGDN